MGIRQTELSFTLARNASGDSLMERHCFQKDSFEKYVSVTAINRRYMIQLRYMTYKVFSGPFPLSGVKVV